MKKLVSLLLALVLIFAISSVAMAATTVNDAAELKAAIVDGAEIVLGNEIELTSTLEIGAGKEVTIDLNGFAISGENIATLVHVANTAVLNVYDNSSANTGAIELVVNNGSTGFFCTFHLEGTLNLYSGLISMDSATAWGYAVDIRPNAWGTEYTEASVLHMFGGNLYCSYDAIRVSSSSHNGYNKVAATFIMDGGTVEAARDGLFVQQQDTEKYDILNVEINAGVVDTERNAIRVYVPMSDGDVATPGGTVGGADNAMTITISGGEVIGELVNPFYNTANDAVADAVDMGITGGSFTAENAVDYIDTDNVDVKVDSNGNIYVGDEAIANMPVPPAPKRYDIKVADTKNGEVTVKSSAAYDSGVIISVLPYYGYELDALTVTDANGKAVKLTERADGTYSFSMPRAAVTVKATFAKQGEPVVMSLTIGSKEVAVNGKTVINDVAPVIKASRTFLPVRLIAENLGATVTWDEPAQRVVVAKGNTTLELFINSTTVLVNGQPAELEAPVFIENSRTFLPVRLIAEKLGATVEWDGATNTVTISGRN